MKNQKTKFVILGLLTIRPLSGYDIKKFIEQIICDFWAESNGQLYPALNQLVKDVYIIEEKQQKGKKVSHLYSITDKGQEALETWLKENIERKITRRDEELLKLFFGMNSSYSTSIELLQKREARVRELLSKYEANQKELEHHTTSPHYPYWLITLNNGLCHIKAELQWCQDSIALLQKQGASYEP